MIRPSQDDPPSAAALRAAFDSAPPYTVGIEDELMLLDPETFELCPRAVEVLALAADDRRFKLELPASQLEIVTPVCQTVAAAAHSLLEARAVLAERSQPHVRLASAGVHPFSSGTGELNQTPRYEHTIRTHGEAASRQLVCALQVHVSIGNADRALQIYNAARSYLPLLAALAANAPYYEGADTGFASVRPKLAQLLPRQGVPPRFDSWEEYAAALRWGATSGLFPDSGSWWWELRPHRKLGTLEFRVPDGQTSVGDAAAIAAVVQALVVWLGERLDDEERLVVAPSWQIAQNSWSACRYGVEGTMASLEAEAQRSTQAVLEDLIGTLEPVASRLGSRSFIEHARSLVRFNGAMAQRAVGSAEGPVALARWLADRFLEPLPG